MEKRIAQIVSILFHPVFITLYGLIILFHSGLYISLLSPALKKWIYLVVGINTAIIPLSLTPLYLNKKIIHSIKMDSVQERVIPLVVSTFLFYFTYFLLTRFKAPDIIRIYILTGAIALFGAVIISWRWKISLHMLGLGSLAGIILALSIRFGLNLNFFLIIIVLVAGITGFARLKLEAHSPAQIYTGYLFGFLLTGSMLLFLF
jgi:hypothetical protein